MSTKVSVRVIIELHDEDPLAFEIVEQEVMRTHPKGLRGRVRRASAEAMDNALSVMRCGLSKKELLLDNTRREQVYQEELRRIAGK